MDTTPCSTDNIQHNIPYSTTPCSPDINASYMPEDYLTPMAGKIMPMKKVFADQFRGIADFFFDYVDTVNDTTGKIDIRPVFKNIPNIALGDFYDGNYVTWGEWYFKATDFFITQDYNSSTLCIQVGQPSLGGYTPTLGSDYTTGWSGMLEVGDTILIYRNSSSDSTPDCCEQLVQKTIVSIDPQTSEICLEAGFNGDPGFVFRQGDRIKKLFHSRQDCSEITNTFGLIPTTAKRSYVQHFGYTISFKKCDLNKAYATPRGAQDFVANRIYHANLELVRQMVFAAYRGRNRGDICTSNQTVPAETQGIITGIIDANARHPELDLITSLAAATSDDDKVRHILDVILKIQSSGMVNTWEVITLVCNQKALAALLKMNNAWNKFTGFQVNTNDNVSKNFSLPIIQTPNGSIEFKNCQILSELYPHEGVILFVPKNNIMVKARKNARYDYTNGQMVQETLGVKIMEVTPFKQHECREFDVYTEMALVIAGLDSGARRMVLGLR